ncbi:hypothetical protein [Acetobacter malorum]|uniref:hypothetical protein n=1 Tax=Acetobacter malorum TaxID=178901 RepID=UPI0039EBD8B7
MRQQRELFVTGVHQVRLNGSTTVPTVVRYEGGKALVGTDALQDCENPSDLREDFKVEIGNEDPSKLAQRIAGTRSILGIAKDFTDRLIGSSLESIAREGRATPTKILVAEPLALSSASVPHERWLQNYRQSMKRILSGRFEEIDFMPEPFAVFQYYRYGVRHFLMAQKASNVALVIDFGGGTFDTCVIETTKTGDISQSGRNAKPLAAKSVPVGGFAVNRYLAEALLMRVVEKGPDRTALNGALREYTRLKNLDDVSLVSEKYAAFAKNYRRLLQSVEQAKCIVCNGMPNWKLDAEPPRGLGCTVDVPNRPLDERSPMSPIRLDAALLWQVFEQKVWKSALLPAVRETLQRARNELGTKPVTVVLLSGGSSNIRWLKPLLDRDLGEALRDAEVLELSENFQEIVAKGLAIECARRFYTDGDGDFRAVTYNRLCLGLNANGNGVEFKRFTPDKELECPEAEPGVVLPSATFLKSFIGKPMRWKVRPTHLPSRSLDYYFMRSSFDIEDMAARQNLDHRLSTPSGVRIGPTVGVELLVREDGTAEPTFLYGRGDRDGRTTSIKGNPFYLDMTFATEAVGGSTYLGLDFGTSTSSVCYVDGTDIQSYTARSVDKTWRHLSDLVNLLPYPAANPLAKLISATGDERMAKASREALEGMLALAVYTAYAEHRSISHGRSAYFKGLRQCSAGPLWRTLKDMGKTSGQRWIFCKELMPLLTGSLLDEMDHAVAQVAPGKHGKKANAVDWPRILEQFGNALAKVFEGRIFGYFEDAQKKAFSKDRYTGFFRSARGPSSTFNDIYMFEGPEGFAREFVFVFDLESGTGLPLFPLFVRGIDGDTATHLEPDFFSFDLARDDRYEFKAVQEREAVTLEREGEFGELRAAVCELMEVDTALEPVVGFKFRKRMLD